MMMSIVAIVCESLIGLVMLALIALEIDSRLASRIPKKKEPPKEEY